MDRPITIIEPNQSKQNYLRDLLSFYQLFFFFAWRDILVRYKQTFFGVSWALLRPLLNMGIFALIFGKIANLSSEGENYFLFVLVALLPWQFFAFSVSEGSMSLIGNAATLTKVYFPRAYLPLCSMIPNFIDYLLGLLLLLIISAFAVHLHIESFLIIPFSLLSLLLTAGCLLWLSALTAKYRDFRFIIPFFIQFGMFISPVGYGTFLISEKWQLMYFLNPLVGIIDGFRWAIFGSYHSYMIYSISFSVAITSFLLLSGFNYFKNLEKTLADII